jgi:hypothetical protein
MPATGKLSSRVDAKTDLKRSGIPPGQAYVHYVPVNEDLSDLVEKLEWAKAHDQEAKEIAANAHQFACEHIAQEACDEYLYHLLVAYSKLNFIE